MSTFTLIGNTTSGTQKVASDYSTIAETLELLARWVDLSAQFKHRGLGATQFKSFVIVDERARVATFSADAKLDDVRSRELVQTWHREARGK